MEIKLKKDLSHQLIPVMSVADVVGASPLELIPTASHRNPELVGAISKEGVNNCWSKDHIALQCCKYTSEPENFGTKAKNLPHYQLLDIKMETGTGKTYVYTRTMMELHKRFGYNKFIVVVPTLPIKAGVASFVADSANLHHFSDVCGYHSTIELCNVEAQNGKSTKKGRRNFPTAVGRFFLGNHHESNKIYLLLLNSQLITNGKLLTRDDYDQELGGFFRPVDAIADTRPVVIIDEPHRMPRDSKSYITIVSLLKPQLLIRYGATFPEISIGRGKGKKVERDYVNLIYDLDAADAFEQNLIKGVAKEHLDIPGGKNPNKKVKVTGIESKSSVNLLYVDGKSSHTFCLHTGDSLGQIDPDLDGLSINGIGNSCIELSNGQEKEKGMEFFPDQFSASYQEAMIRLALKRHFEVERMNFERKPTRIKTLALFFIDSIKSFRGPKGGNDGWLRKLFIELLRETLNNELKKQNSDKYAEYLQATLDDIEHSCAGYFAQDASGYNGGDDTSDDDNDIAKEVNTILRGKKQLLSFEDENGKLNICRFLFSKWTLKEGWDNPNVFTICKLRSSGSDTSKLQEVGRGLRLPVDEEGNRIEDKTFFLNYIVDFTEKDFASKLVREINGDKANSDTGTITQLSEEEIRRVANELHKEETAFFIELLQKKYVDMNKNIVQESYQTFADEYPQFFTNSHVKNRNQSNTDMVGIRKQQFEEIKDLWAKLNAKYVLYFDENIDDAISKELPKVIIGKRVFSQEIVDSHRVEIDVTGHIAKGLGGSSTQIALQSRPIAYNEFLKRASRSTSVPITVIHQGICEAFHQGEKITNNLMNEGSLTRLVYAIKDWMANNLWQKVRYKEAHYQSEETRLTNADGSIKDEVAKVYIGRKEDENSDPPRQYIYDKLVYDSSLEKENIIQSDIDSVVVYGKIPSSSICIPTIASSNYSPDFMYVVKKSDGTKELNIIIETKAYDRDSSITADEEVKIFCAEEFFKEMRERGYNIKFTKQINSKKVKGIIEELIESK